MRRRWSWRASSLVLVAMAAPGGAATIRERHVALAIEGATYVRSEKLRVALEEEGDLAAWSVYAIPMDVHAEMVRAEARVLGADGREVASVPRRKHERLESPGYDLHSSSWMHLIRFPALAVGQSIEIDVEVRLEPYYPCAQVLLALGSRQEKLTVRVEAPGLPLRHRISGPGGSLRSVTVEGGLAIDATDVPAHRDEPLSPSLPEGPVLRLAWDGEGTWASVGEWYRRLASRSAGDAPTVAARARELTATTKGAREKVAALASYVKQRVRYEAVEVGVGGYVPHEAPRTLERGWGDCKDKSELLRRMLEAVSIPSRLVLLHAGPELQVDRDFPAPDQFNHCILAVPAAAAGAVAGDPVAGGMLFIDATDDRGGIGWLSPWVQGDHALVVDGAGSELVRLPDLVAAETRDLSVEGGIDAAGDLHAAVVLKLRGDSAADWLAKSGGASAARIEASIATLLGQVLPSAELSEVAWESPSGDVPAVDISAKARQAGVLRGAAPERWLPAAALTALPGARILVERRSPVRLSAGRSTTRYRLALPPGCVPEPAAEDARNSLGNVTHRVSAGAAGELLLERSVEIASSRVEVPDLPLLAELCVAETRAEKRRAILRCPASPPD